MPIIPTVGRKVWYFENNTQTEPWDGTVVRVMPAEGADPAPDTPCNIYVVDPGGVARLIPQIQVGGEATIIPHYRWMPYQQAQAAKT